MNIEVDLTEKLSSDELLRLIAMELAIKTTVVGVNDGTLLKRADDIYWFIVEPNSGETDQE